MRRAVTHTMLRIQAEKASTPSPVLGWAAAALQKPCLDRRRGAFLGTHFCAVDEQWGLAALTHALKFGSSSGVMRPKFEYSNLYKNQNRVIDQVPDEAGYNNDSGFELDGHVAALIAGTISEEGKLFSSEPFMKDGDSMKCVFLGQGVAACAYKCTLELATSQKRTLIVKKFKPELGAQAAFFDERATSFVKKLATKKGGESWRSRISLAELLNQANNEKTAAKYLQVPLAFSKNPNYIVSDSSDATHNLRAVTNLAKRRLDLKSSEWRIYVGKVITRLVLAVNYLHDNGMHHNDIKAENMVISAKNNKGKLCFEMQSTSIVFNCLSEQINTFRVIDFGTISLEKQQGRIFSRGKVEGLSGGTPRMMLPTSTDWVGCSVKVEANDWWASIVTFVELLSGNYFIKVTQDFWNAGEADGLQELLRMVFNNNSNFKASPLEERLLSLMKLREKLNFKNIQEALCKPIEIDGEIITFWDSDASHDAPCPGIQSETTQEN